jgi:hypothetical protein
MGQRKIIEGKSAANGRQGTPRVHGILRAADDRHPWTPLRSASVRQILGPLTFGKSPVYNPGPAPVKFDLL